MTSIRQLSIFVSFCFIRKIGLVVAWVFLIVLAYRVLLIEIEHKEYDPFGVLGIDRVGKQE